MANKFGKGRDIERIELRNISCRNNAVVADRASIGHCDMRRRNAEFGSQFGCFDKKRIGNEITFVGFDGANMCLQAIEIYLARQKVLEKFHYGSATKDQPFKRWRPKHEVPTEKYEKDVEHWEKLLKQIGYK